MPGVRFRIFKVSRAKVCAALDPYAMSAPVVQDHPKYPVIAYLVDYPHPHDPEGLYSEAQAHLVYDLERY